jgi:hypothetical protein
MEQQSISPVAKSGILPNNDYADYKTPQDLFNAFAAYLEISVEAGETGAKGDSGEDANSLITWGLVLDQEIAIPIGVDELNTGLDLTNKIVRVRAPEGHSTTQEENFTVGVIEDTGVAPNINSYVHFVFTKDSGDTPVVARTGWILEVWSIGQL